MQSSLLEQFRDELEQRCMMAGFTCNTWVDIRPIKKNLILINGYAPLILYVKERGSDHGFWGVTANRINKLRDSCLRWNLVLLAGKPSSAHVLCDRQVIEKIESGNWTLGNDGDYKINQGSMLSSEARLKTYEQIFGVLL